MAEPWLISRQMLPPTPPVLYLLLVFFRLRSQAIWPGSGLSDSCSPSKLLDTCGTCESGNWDQRNLYFRCAQSSRRPTTQYYGNLHPLPQTNKSRLNHWQNLKTINLRDQASHDSGNVPLKKTKNMPIMLEVLLLEKVQKLCSFFQIMPILMLAQSIRAYRINVWLAWFRMNGTLRRTNLRLIIKLLCERNLSRMLNSLKWGLQRQSLQNFIVIHINSMSVPIFLTGVASLQFWKRNKTWETVGNYAL